MKETGKKDFKGKEKTQLKIIRYIREIMMILREDTGKFVYQNLERIAARISGGFKIMLFNMKSLVKGL